MDPILIAVTFALVAGVFGWFGLVENTKKYITDEQKAFVRKNIFNLKD